LNVNSSGGEAAVVRGGGKDAGMTRIGCVKTCIDMLIKPATNVKQTGEITRNATYQYATRPVLEEKSAQLRIPVAV
jgi:hypothetical protein